MKKNAVIFTMLTLSAVFFTNCSSAPKRPMVITTIQTNANQFLEIANASVITGNYDKAEQNFNTAYSLAMSIDNPELLSDICIGRVNLYLSYNPPLIDKAKYTCKMAADYANMSENSVKQNALVTISDARIMLFENPDNISCDLILIKLNSCFEALKKDPYAQGQYYTVAADAYKAKQDYANAILNLQEAIKLFTDNRYLAELGISWYKLAQYYSLDNNKTEAVNAINQAIYYDRCAENSSGLAMDYYAKGRILIKNEYTMEQKNEAVFSFNHSAEIYKSIGSEDYAQRSLSKAEELSK